MASRAENGTKEAGRAIIFHFGFGIERYFMDGTERRKEDEVEKKITGTPERREREREIVRI